MITFREMVHSSDTDPEPGRPQHWHLECYPDNSPLGVFPVGTAFVEVAAASQAAIVRYVFVIDEFRRNGHGTELVRAIEHRWQRITFDRRTESGTLFLQAVVDTSEHDKRKAVVMRELRRLVESREE